jgi:serine/threonine protein kinase
MLKQKINTQKEMSKLLGQGTYGCVYRPAMHCKTMKPMSKNYVSKIHRKLDVTQGELAAGTKIKNNVRNYSLFFAPILETCDIRISQLDDEQLNQCAPIQEHKTEAFSSSKMDYVGKYTLRDYFEKELSNARTPNDMQDFAMKLIDSHMYLLHSAEILNGQNIIHLDIKGNNVMYHEKNHVFVIIDFGLSIDSNDLDIKNMESSVNSKRNSITRSYVNSYNPWNIDIVLLSYIASRVKEGVLPGSNFDEKITDIKPIKQVVSEFMGKNKLFKNPNFTENELAVFENKYRVYIQTWKNRTWREVWNELYEHHKSWDAYGINAMFLQLLMNTNIMNFLKASTKELPVEPSITNGIKMAFTGSASQIKTVHFFKQYIEYLKGMILSSPKEHCVPLDCISKIKTIFGKVPVAMVDQWEDYMKKKIVTSKNMERVNHNLKEATLDAIREENRLLRAAQ